ncbi:MAG TPA: TonB-dependent receptor [Candidatus Odoribacter faecigallinarum]|uniref:TonB-dependent receptor n=1 Tax=Candidatus Odoribacter faecigallinarum TaxID=2838706 RepID=A0A9D1V1D6_9BACT|nr:TonB-dependent receptor [Candidatus Odoribacter faecigallinarum]
MRKILLILFSMVAVQAWGEDEISPAAVATIRGVVLDETGVPLPGASVWVKGSTIGAGTNTQGEFTLSLRKSGPQVLRFSFTGYKPQEYTWDGKENKVLTIRLEPSLNSLDEVVITGTRTPKPLKEAPVLTQVISEREIEQINPIDFQTLLELALPGLQFGIAHGSNLPELQFQGAAGGYVLFLMDGERIAGEGASNNIDFDRIDVDNIARIEVVKGAMSTLYGSQAMGGVVNIITKNAERPFSADATARWGNKDEMKYSASVGTKLSRFSSYTTFSYSRRDAYQVEDKEGQVTEYHYTDIHGQDSIVRDTSEATSTEVLGFDKWSVSERLGYSFTDNLKLDVTGSYYRNNQLNPYEEQGIQNRFESYTVNPKLYYVFNEQQNLSLSYLLDNYRKKEVYAREDASSTKMKDLSHTVRLNYTGEFGRHLLTAGIEVNTQKMNHYWFNLEGEVEHSQQTYVLYLQEDWKVTDFFDILVGVRSDCHSDYGFHASPKVSLMWRFGDFALRGNYGMGFRIPTLKELYSSFPMGGFGFMIYGNTDLEPEKSHQGTLSLEYTRGVFNGSVSGYYTKYMNEIYLGDFEDEDGAAAQKYYNHENSEKSGIDVMAQVRLDCGFRFNGSYSYVNSHEKEDGYNTSVFRPHSLTFTTNYSRQWGKVRANASLNGRWLSKVDVWYKNSEGAYVLTPRYAYTTVDFNLGARFPRGFRFTLAFDNILNLKAKNGASDSSVVPQRGIEVIGTLGINFADLFKL